MERTLLISIIGSAATITQIIRIVPQVIKGFVTKEVDDLSITFEIISLLSGCFWLTYGLLTDSMELVIANAITIIAFILLLIQKAVY